MTNYVRNPTWADGSGGATPITAAKLNNIEDGIYAAHFQPCARVYGVQQTITNGAATALAFASERFDTDTIHDTVTNNSRLTCKTAGKYLIAGNVSWSVNATGQRLLQIRLNGATMISSNAVPGASFDPLQAITTVYDLAVNDYVELVVYQDSGASRTINVTDNATPEFMIVRVA